MRVRPEFLDELKRRTRRFNALVDENGEVCPWVEVRLGEPQLTTRIDTESITRSFRNGWAGAPPSRASSANCPTTQAEIP